jgi:pyrroloquinoline quinone (PQQ) biosynthesis protein C
MDTTTLLAGHRLLDHPFYRRWEEGLLEAGELAAYAAQYRHFEAQLPSFLAELAGALPEGSARALIEANLADELDGPETHLALFERFAEAVEAPVESASPAMAELVSLYADAADGGDPDYALGVLAGYEVQASEVAVTKGAGLAQHYGVEAQGLEFWALHGEVEVDHARWTLEAASLADAERFSAGAEASARAWWSFLDEREALVAAR